MKHLQIRNLLLLLLLSFTIIACKDDKEDPDNTPIPGPVPTIVLSSSQATGNPETTVTTTVSVTAPVGLKKLNIYKNNATTPESVNFNYERTATHLFNYTIEPNLTNGTVVNFTFEAIDSLDRKSESKQFSVTVTVTPDKEIVQVTGDVNANTTWSSDKIWRLNGIVKVTAGNTLTIEPGTIIFGASDTKGTLVIERGAKIMADGTASAPIVFTSDKAPGNRAPGDWSGVVICGKSPNNQSNSISVEGLTGIFHGGTVANDNSGILRYVRIEFAGNIVQDNKEINSLTLASVGNGTVIENVQCSYGLDDSFEFFGGTVNAKNLISYRTKDDDFDFDFGHRGFIQFALAIRDASLADQYYSNGIEIDNDGAGTNATPATQPVLSNISIIGAKYSASNTIDANFLYAAHIRRNSMPTLYNSFLTGYPNGLCLDDTKQGVSAYALTNDLQVRNIILAGVENWGNNNWGGSVNNQNNSLRHIGVAAPTFDISTWYNLALHNNRILSKWEDAGIDQSLYTTVSPKVTPNSGSILLTAGSWTNTPKAADSFFEKVTFAGAVGTTDWTAQWANFDPQTTEYK